MGNKTTSRRDAIRELLSSTLRDCQRKILDKPEALDIMSDPCIINVLKSYSEPARNGIAIMMSDIAECPPIQIDAFQYDKASLQLKKVSKLLNSDALREKISANENLAWDIALSVVSIAEHAQNKKEFDSICKLLWKYDPISAIGVADVFGNLLRDVRSESKIFSQRYEAASINALLHLFETEEIIKFSNRHAVNSVLDEYHTINNFGNIALNCAFDKNVIKTAMDTINLYENEYTAQLVSFLILESTKFGGSISEQKMPNVEETILLLQNSQELMELHKHISKEAMQSVIEGLTYFGSVYPMDKMLRLSAMIYKLRRNVFADSINNVIADAPHYNNEIQYYYSRPRLYKDLNDMIEQDLDKLVNTKNDLDVVLLYINTNKLLPKPNSENLSNYMSLALGYFSEKYKLNKPMIADQLMLFASIFKEDDRLTVIRMFNQSVESSIKKYSLSSTAKEKRIDYTQQEMMRYAIISLVGSKCKAAHDEAANVASQIFGEKLLNRAITEFNSKYKHLKKAILN